MYSVLCGFAVMFDLRSECWAFSKSSIKLEISNNQTYGANKGYHKIMLLTCEDRQIQNTIVDYTTEAEEVKYQKRHFRKTMKVELFFLKDLIIILIVCVQSEIQKIVVPRLQDFSFYLPIQNYFSKRLIAHFSFLPFGKS